MFSYMLVHAPLLVVLYKNILKESIANDRYSTSSKYDLVEDTMFRKMEIRKWYLKAEIEKDEDKMGFKPLTLVL